MEQSNPTEPRDESEPTPEQGLNPKQEAFCQEYIKDLNGTQAAIRAGYSDKSAKVQASRLLTNDNVTKRIQGLMDARSKRVQIDADYVLNKIHETVERCSQAEPVMEYDRDDKCMKPTGEWKFEHQGVLKGCELLGKHLKLFTERHEHSGPEGKPIEVKNLSDSDLDAQIEKLQALITKQGKKE